MLVFNVEKLIHDVGGVNVVAKMTDKLGLNLTAG